MYVLLFLLDIRLESDSFAYLFDYTTVGRASD